MLPQLGLFPQRDREKKKLNKTNKKIPLSRHMKLRCRALLPINCFSHTFLTTAKKEVREKNKKSWHICTHINTTPLFPPSMHAFKSFVYISMYNELSFGTCPTPHFIEWHQHTRHWNDCGRTDCCPSMSHILQWLQCRQVQENVMRP